MKWTAGTRQPPEPGFRDEWVVRDIHDKVIASDLGEANARAIAALPELLAVCELLALYPALDHPTFYSVIKQAQDAIAKTKGGE